MGVMGSPPRVVLALVVILALVSCTFAKFAGYDGLPRPSGFKDQPTTVLGAKPAVKYATKPANCIWYSWENYAYPPRDTKNCSNLLWVSLTENPSGLEGFSYYAPMDEFYDPSFQQYLCVIGCFDLSGTAGPSLTPSTSPATPPLASTPPVTSPPLAMPPAVAPTVMSPPLATPPTITPTTPPFTAPPIIAPPPPATLFRPPPPGLPLPPSYVVSPPTGPSQAPGPFQAPGPSTQTGAGSAVRIFSVSTILVISASVVGIAL